MKYVGSRCVVMAFLERRSRDCLFRFLGAHFVSCAEIENHRDSNCATAAFPGCAAGIGQAVEHRRSMIRQIPSEKMCRILALKGRRDLLPGRSCLRSQRALSPTARMRAPFVTSRRHGLIGWVIRSAAHPVWRRAPAAQIPSAVRKATSKTVALFTVAHSDAFSHRRRRRLGWATRCSLWQPR